MHRSKTLGKTLGFAAATFVLGLFVGCGGSEGEPGEACVNGTLCFNGLVCVDGICAADDGTTMNASLSTTMTMTLGDTVGDGDPTGDGDPSTGDGDPSAAHGLYEGPCLTSEDCAEGLFCGWANGRFWCSLPCADANDTSCPTYEGASATPECNSIVDNGGSGSQWGCTLVCTDTAECPAGAQCFGSGIGSQQWCGFLD